MHPDQAKLLRGKLESPGPIRLSDVENARQQTRRPGREDVAPPTTEDHSGRLIAGVCLLMATIIRLADPSHDPHAVAFNFDDLTAQAAEHVTQANAQAAKIVAEAQQEAESIRQQAADEGRQAAIRAAKQTAVEQVAPALSALRQAVADLHRPSKRGWRIGNRAPCIWPRPSPRESSAASLAGNRRSRSRLVREALELAAGSPSVRAAPQSAGSQEARARRCERADRGHVRPRRRRGAADATIERGGCRVETRFGTIDQQFESQLKRIEEELTG